MFWTNQIFGTYQITNTVPEYLIHLDFHTKESMIQRDSNQVGCIKMSNHSQGLYQSITCAQANNVGKNCLVQRVSILF